MSLGSVWPSEWREYTDPTTGTSVLQLTDYRCHSHHLYFSSSGWYNSGRNLIFGSDRGNRANLFSINLKTGEITQLTDLQPIKSPYQTELLFTCLNPKREEAYFWYDRKIIALDLNTLETRSLWNMPEGFVPTILSCTADGESVCGGLYENLYDRLVTNPLSGDLDFNARWEAHPLSKIVKVALDGGGADIIWEERTWIGHVNTSPTQPKLITFCHEGPWHRVDNRIWGLDLDSGKTWPIRPRVGREIVGHEYWLSDGLNIGYHGKWPVGEFLFGRIRYDNTYQTEFRTSCPTGHMHSNDFSLIVGDGRRDGRFILVWRCNDEGIEGPRLLCEHRSSFHIQRVHVHPRFDSEGRRVVYTSDATGYGNLYLADVPKFESLPKYVSERKLA